MWHFRDIFKKSKDRIPFGQLSLFLLSFRSDFNALAKMLWFPPCIISIWSNHFWWFFFHGHFLRKTSMMLLLNCFSFSKWSCGFLHIGLAVGQCHKTSKRCLTDEIIFWMPSQLLFRTYHKTWFPSNSKKKTITIYETLLHRNRFVRNSTAISGL